MDAILSSDFVFDRGKYNRPFVPLGYLNLNWQDNVQVDAACRNSTNYCRYDYQDLHQGLGVPLWVGQKHLFLAGESLESDTLRFNQQTLRINTVGLLFAWIMQANPKLQVGAFTYSYYGFDLPQNVHTAKGRYTGAMSRVRHSAQFHSYWGAIQFKQDGESVYYPYLGFDWSIGARWGLSAIIPWPTLSYAPNTDRVYKLGALYSGNEWYSDLRDNQLKHDLDHWRLGLSVEQRLHGMIWGGLRIGYSGFGKLALATEKDLEFTTDVDSKAFFSIVFTLRPQ